MKSMKFIKSALIVGSLVIATSAFADMPSTINSAGITTGTVSHVSSSTLTNGTSKSQLSAFTDVSTTAVSQVELNQVSGDGLIPDPIRRFLENLKKGRKNPACFTSRAYCR